ncbi:MAG: hypothetical protein ABIH42_02040 [Planctomycetota bacterium]
MEIKLKCSCGELLKVGIEAAGRTGPCPSCGRQLRVPTLDELQAQQASAPQTAPPQHVHQQVVPQAHIQQQQPPQAVEPPQQESAVRRAPTRIAPIRGKAGTSSRRTRGIRVKSTSRLRGKTSASSRRMRPNTDEEIEEGEEYAPSGDKKKTYMVAGGIAGAAILIFLIGYFGFIAPNAAKKQRFVEYIKTGREFKESVAKLCNELSGKEAPASPAAFNSKVGSIKSQFEDGPAFKSENAPEIRALGSYKKMKEVLEKLEKAKSIVSDKQSALSSGDNAKIAQLEAEFSVILEECRDLANKIEKALDSGARSLK